MTTSQQDNIYKLVSMVEGYLKNNTSSIHSPNITEVSYTYYTSGPNIGNLETETYKNGSSTLYTITYQYDNDGNLSSSTKTCP